MKKVLFSLLFLALTGTGGAAFSFPGNTGVLKSEQPRPMLRIPDSLDLSDSFHSSLSRREVIGQYNRLIGVYLVFAMDTLKAGNIAGAEQIMMGDVLPLLSRFGNGYNMYHSFMTLGKSYHGQKKYTQAKWFFIQSNTISKKIGYRPGQLFSLIELAKVKEDIQDADLALADYKAAAALATKIKFTTTLISINKSIKRLTTVEKSTIAAEPLEAAQNVKN